MIKRFIDWILGLFRKDNRNSQEETVVETVVEAPVAAPIPQKTSIGLSSNRERNRGGILADGSWISPFCIRLLASQSERGLAKHKVGVLKAQRKRLMQAERKLLNEVNKVMVANRTIGDGSEQE